MKIMISKIAVTIMTVLIMLYGVKNVYLGMFGEKTTGYIIGTTQRIDKDSDTNVNRYRNTVSYYFEVSGKRYEGQTSYKTDMPIVRKEDQIAEKVVVQYFTFLPYFSNLEKYNENTLSNNLFGFGLVIGCILFILVLWGVIFKKKKVKRNQKDNKDWICDCGAQNDGKFCEICGRNKDI